jgi:hypothetical protein
MRRYKTCFTISVTVKTVIQANTIKQLRAKIRDELREPDSYLTLPSTLVYDSDKLKFQSDPNLKHHMPTNNNLIIERELALEMSELKLAMRLKSDPLYFEELESQL